MKKRSIIEDLFSIRKSGIWKDFANELNAEFIDGGFFKEDQLIIKQSDWVILIDVYLSHFNLRIPNTRITAACRDKQPFNFKIESKNRTIFPSFWTIRTESELINKKYYIRSSNKEKAINLFKKELINQLLLDIDSLNLKYEKTGLLLNEGIIYPELQHTERGYIRDVERLKKIVRLFIEILNYLSKNEIIEKI